MTKGLQLWQGILCAAWILLIWILPTLACAASAEVRVVGWIEHILLQPEDIMIKAKLDTGAKNSSIHAENITRFKKNDKVWVRFTVIDFNKKSYVLERPLVRTAIIKERNGTNQERPVVEMTICLGDIKKTTEVNLVNRKKFLYKFLIGRSYLMGNFAVDPNAKYTAVSKCSDAPKK